MSDNLRDRIARALREHDAFGCGCCAFVGPPPGHRSTQDEDDEQARAVEMADAIMALLTGYAECEHEREQSAVPEMGKRESEWQTVYGPCRKCGR